MTVEGLTVDYLEDHRSIVHSYDSFGRSVAELMIQEARRMVLAKETEASPSAIEFRADVRVSAKGSDRWLGVEICVPSIGCSKIHVAPS